MGNYMQLGHRGGGNHKHTTCNTAGAEGCLIVKPPLADGIKGEREKLESSASVELVLELNPAGEGREILH